MSPNGNLPATALNHDDEASALFVRRLYGEWNDADQAAFEMRLADDAAFAQAYRRVDDSWRALDAHAEAPELVSWRAEAIDLMRRANARRWFKPKSTDRRVGYRWRVAAAVAGLAGALGVVWQLSPYGYRPGQYLTAIGEQRTVELQDHSRITLDSATRLRVRFTDETRSIHLLEGQAQFSVARDSARPFKVIAGNRIIVALGTVFTVEYIDRKIQVAMLEGKVAVQEPERQGSEEIYLVAGEGLQAAGNGHTVVTPKADLEAATAWRAGKVIFRTEPLGEAVSRMNRYSRQKLEIDDAALAAKHISGVFEAGDTRGFVNALRQYLSIDVDESDSDTIRLKTH